MKKVVICEASDVNYRHRPLQRLAWCDFVGSIKKEASEFSGFLRLQNAEVGIGPIFPDKYAKEDLAPLHLKKIN